MRNMIVQTKDQYISPISEVLEMSTESAILQMSGGKYSPYDGEKI